jgi:peptidoglycan/LPS O-acetylase OafA/YrhL
VLSAFYARRFLRIFPAYYAALLAAALLGLPLVRESLPWHLAYLSNHYIAARGSWPDAPVCHLWSLAVEEQFYLVWPALVLLAPARRLAALFAAAVCLGPACRALLAGLDGHTVRSSVFTACCLDSLGLGALLALLRHHGADRARSWLCRGSLALGLALFAASAGSSLLGAGGLFRAAAKYGSYALLSTWLVDRACDGFAGAGRRLLECRPLAYLGAISYGVYLYHDFVPAALRALDVGPRPTAAWGGAVKFLYVLAVTLPVAALSWHLFERPLNGLKKWFPYVRPAAGPAARPARAGAAA